MTEEEFEDAYRLITKNNLYSNELLLGPVYHQGYMKGYDDACESKRAEIEEYKNNYLNACQTVAAMHEAATGVKGEGPKRGVVEDVADVRAALEAERARSSKLIHMLESIDRRAGSASQQSGWTDAIEVAEWARKAVAEYEASK